MEMNKLPSEIIECELDKILEERGFKNASIKISAGSEKGDNYMGLLYRITAEKADGKKFTLVCKTEPTSAVRREEMRTGMVFVREVYVYDNIFPAYEKFQEEKSIPESARFNNYPKCFRTGEGFLFLHDLRQDGYDMYDRLKDLDFVHAKLAVEALGKLHGVGFALKHQRPEVFERFRKMHDTFFGNPTEGLYGYFHTMFDQATAALDSEEDTLRTKMETMNKNLEKEIPRLLSGEEAEPYAIVTHGDCWNNNIMYKYENGVPVAACLLDFQMSRYASPALDLAYYIFCCTEQKFRDMYYTQVLQAYYKSLSASLHAFGCDPSAIFPYEALEDQMKRFGVYGLAMATVLVKTIRSKGDDIPDMDALAEKMREDKDYTKQAPLGSEESLIAYQARIAEVIRDTERLGMI